MNSDPEIAKFITPLLESRAPLLVLLAGPNGACKSAFFESHLHHLRLDLVNPDLIQASLGDINAAVTRAGRHTDLCEYKACCNPRSRW